MFDHEVDLRLREDRAEGRHSTIAVLDGAPELRVRHASLERWVSEVLWPGVSERVGGAARPVEPVAAGADVVEEVLLFFVVVAVVLWGAVSTLAATEERGGEDDHDDEDAKDRTAGGHGTTLPNPVLGARWDDGQLDVGVPPLKSLASVVWMLERIAAFVVTMPSSRFSVSEALEKFSEPTRTLAPLSP